MCLAMNSSPRLAAKNTCHTLFTECLRTVYCPNIYAGDMILFVSADKEKKLSIET